MKLQYEVSTLGAVKDQCQSELARLYELVQNQRHKIEELQQCLMDTHHQLKNKEEHIQKSRKTIAFLKAHLEVIALGLEESNLSRRMLLNLLAQIP